MIHLLLLSFVQLYETEKQSWALKEAELQAKIEQLQKELKDAKFGEEGMHCSD